MSRAQPSEPTDSSTSLSSASTAKKANSSIPIPEVPPRSVAVIDIGATSIRMEVAQIDSEGEIKPLTRLVRPVELGRDAFTSRRFRRSSIEQAVSILKNYQHVLREFGIESPEQIRIVATSAVREASNRLQFLDRVYIATGLQVESIDAAEVNRITYMGILPHLEQDAELSAAKSVVVEVGGGSTEMLVIREGNVLASETYRLGAVRLARLLETMGAPVSKRRAIMENQIGQTISQIQESVRIDTRIELIAIGGDIRFVANLFDHEWDGDSLAALPLEQLEEITNDVLLCDEDQIVRKFGLSFSEAETLGPALLTYLQLARAFDLKVIHISDTNMRDGLLHEMAANDSLTEGFRQQIIRSAVSLGRRFDFDETFARHTAGLASELFEQLRDEHGLESRYEVILYLGALLHEIGEAINDRSNHKHAMYIIRNSDLFGLTQQDVLLVALLARYHRRAFPQPSHDGYGTLDLARRVIVSKLAAILRLAIALNASRSGRVKQVKCISQRNRLVLQIPGLTDVSLEQLAIRYNRGLFEEIYGKPVLLRSER
ncbi:Exopolyphosphatase [Roseimaritima multifibrata]|uniref:Exopolyphosphatase n=1 Tax=Roseimaritima multifibrata TaxID=1930274 RepID=A0A517MMZ8_9BACT|nr:Ppx/GppA phosphatase family protein [Roseimaritima multifibrata]QDS96265.1 Exopolyphosphatase [Roseimaritima multifibrata]